MAVDLVRAQRDALCATLGSLTPAQWRAETLCAGWDAGDVAAHLIIRERETVTAGPGLLVGGPFGAYARRRQARWRARGHAALVATLAAGPTGPLALGPLRNAQVVEDWIHHQDVRRGGAELPTSQDGRPPAAVLWAAMVRYSRRTLARVRSAAVVVALTDGQRRLTVRASPRAPLVRRLPDDARPDVTVTGAPGELLLFVTGREQAAAVEVDGDEAALAALGRASRSV